MADLDIEKLKEFIALAKESGVSELKVETGKEKYSVQFGQNIAYSTPVIHGPQAPSTLATTQTSGESAVNSNVKSKVPGLVEVTSPFVGTFYRSASPGAQAYAKQGDRVSKGQVLCIVEAMKIMNEIESEVSGEIVEICVENETYVEFGQVLFKIKS